MIGDTTLTTHRMRYSTAYPKGRELMLEPLYGCAEEASLRREAARSAPEGPARGRARAYRESDSFAMWSVHHGVTVSMTTVSISSDPFIPHSIPGARAYRN